MELSSGPATQSRHHLWTVQTTAEGTTFSRRSVTSDMRRHGKILTYLLTYLIYYDNLLTGAGRQLLFSVVVSRSIYLRMFVCIFSPLHGTGQLYLKYCITRLRVYVIYFPPRCVGVTNMFPHYSLSPAVKIYRQHRRVRSSSASQKDYRLVLYIA